MRTEQQNIPPTAEFRNGTQGQQLRVHGRHESGQPRCDDEGGHKIARDRSHHHGQDAVGLFADQVAEQTLALLLGSWGACGECCVGDLDASDTVDAADLAILLGAWGPVG